MRSRTDHYCRSEPNGGECRQVCGAQRAWIQGSCGCNDDGYTLCDIECVRVLSGLQMQPLNPYESRTTPVV